MTEHVAVTGAGPTGLWPDCEPRVAGVPTAVPEHDPAADRPAEHSRQAWAGISAAPAGSGQGTVR
ncbi:hypothetical protein SUDANB9_07634 [Streptomyces sp. enrichment culture]